MEILLFGALLAFFIWRSNRKKQKATLEAYQHALEYANAMNAAPYLKGDGSFSQEVVGESFYKDSFKTIRAYIEQNHPGEDEVVCFLVADPSNRFDKNAVRVMAGDLQVGHIPREVAEIVRGQLNNLGGSAKVTGRFHFGKHNSVRLDMKIPLETQD
jgi:HIRAN domain.